MITEDYVSFETAKLLKEKGFDWNCESKRFYPEPDYDQESPDGVYAPKKKKGEHIIYTYPIYDGKFIEWKYNIWFDNSYMFMGQILEFGTDNVFKTREEACEAAIKYYLENLM